MKLMIATPCHGGKCDNTFALSLAETIIHLQKEKIEYELLLPYTGSILSKERNKILWAFMESDCTHLLTIDSDIAWKSEYVLAMLSYNKDIIAGVYPARTNTGMKKFLFVGDHNENSSLKTEGKLLKMLGVPAGFMMITKKCIKKMQDFHPKLKYSDVDIVGHSYTSYAFYNTEIIDGAMWGEDYVFCKYATDAGINIWCDPTMVFNHAGTVGCLLEILTDKR